MPASRGDSPAAFALSLAITTYERPDALDAVLTTAACQTSQPQEIIVADDGSGASTRDVVQRFSARSGVPVHHVRQEHDGYRLARLRNLAIARASGRYLVFADGDMLLHRDFIADHRRIARAGYFTQGVRVMLSARLTERLLGAPGEVPRAASPGLGTLRRLYTLRSPRASAAMRGLANHLVAIKGCNAGFWREDLLAVNGFNEDFVGWGPEDKELAERLRAHGVRRQTLLFGGIAWHLHHAPAVRSRHVHNERLYQLTRARRLARCERGLDSHR